MILIGNNVYHRGRTARQRAGLVEHDGVDARQLLHVAAALDDDAGPCGMGHGRQHGCRRRDANTGAVIDNDERKEAVEIA